VTEAGGKQAVLLLHGLLMNRHAMALLALHLRAAGFATHAINYHSLLDDPEAHVAATLQAFRALNFRRVHLVGHSMGGVVMLKSVERMPEEERQGRLGHALALGSPLTGCEAARAMQRHALGLWALGRSVELWRHGYPLRIPSGVVTGSVAGTRRFGLGAVLNDLQGANDGVVRVEETRLPGLADHLSLPVSHSGMLVSGEVARQCSAFLRDGTFRREQRFRREA
jgi:pimeloyl-ACP methyl ester carboxylesterase